MNTLRLTDSGYNQTSANPEMCNKSFTFEDQFLMFGLHMLMECFLWTRNMVLSMQLLCLREYDLSQNFTILLYLPIYKGNLPNSEYNAKVFVDVLTFSNHLQNFL
jgi:hypothetical protein